VTLALVEHRARANELQCYWRAKQIHDPQHNFKRIGSGPDQGPLSFKDEDPEPEAEEEAAATGEGDRDATGGVVEAESGDAEAEAEADTNANAVNTATEGTPAVVVNGEVQPEVNGAVEGAAQVDADGGEQILVAQENVQAA
jgi:hypothetical protein